MRNPWLAAALILPFLVLGHGIWRYQSNLAAAGEWRIPISGYDPRDPLRGQYIRFTYDWELRGNSAPCLTEAGCNLCLTRERGHVIATVAEGAAKCPAFVDTRSSDMEALHSFPAGRVVFGSRTFVSETSAPGLEAQLREGPMEVVAALTPDGRLINRRIEAADR